MRAFKGTFCGLVLQLMYAKRECGMPDIVDLPSFIDRRSDLPLPGKVSSPTPARLADGLGQKSLP
jgi:hypothetical protein